VTHPDFIEAADLIRCAAHDLIEAQALIKHAGGRISDTGYVLTLAARLVDLAHDIHPIQQEQP
jgi:hypothetical protein